MRHNHILAASLLGGLMILSAACVKEEAINEKYRPAGSEIVFSAATGYNNGTSTRTEYSGYINNSNDYERIDWVREDPMTIVYMHGSDANQTAKFAVSGTITPDKEMSSAEIEAVDTKLYWGEGAGDHYFYAMYPANGFKNNGTANLTGKKVQGTIPATQTVTLNNGIYQPAMQYGYMVAYKKVDATSTTTSVELPFRPAMTAFQFRFSTEDDAAQTVSSFEMSAESDALAGAFEFDINGGDERGATVDGVTTSGTTNKITVNFSGGTPKIEKDKVLDFTVFALPVPMTKVTIKLKFSDGTSKRLELKKNATTWFDFTATKKYLITNTKVPGAEVWDYVIEEIPDLTTYGRTATTSPMPFNVVSYKIKRGTTTKVPVAWSLKYCPKGSSTWSDTPDDKINVNVTSGDGSAVTTPNGANVIRNHRDDEYTGDAPYDVDGSTAALRTAEEIPDAAKDGDGYYDLSRHPVYGDDQFATAQNIETANCYIIQRPGLYKFPLVYGNALKNGADNKASYDVSSESTTDNASYFLGHFQRHDNAAITKPWIKDNGITVDNAIIVWQDGTSTVDGVIIQDSKVSVDGDYIKFEVERDRIRPGNVIIAARSGNTIVWSWHIWVTEKDLSPKAITDYLGNVNHMMEYNLGWLDATNARSTKWNDWTMNVRITQAESGKQVTFKVRQIGPTISVESNLGSNTFYQWGRKDPMLPAAFNNSDKAQYSKHNLLWEKSTNHIVGTGASTFGHSIQHPNYQYVSMNNGHDVNGGYWPGYTYYGNLWDSGLKNDGSVGTFGNRFPVKTVYDPSPRGFVVPYEYAYTGFHRVTEPTYPNPLDYAYLNQRRYQQNHSGTMIWHNYNVIRGGLWAEGFRFEDPNKVKIYFPFCGARAHDGNHGNTGNSVYDVSTLGYYWTTCPSKYNSTSNYSGVEGRMTAKMMILVKDGDDSYIRVAHEQRKGAAYAVRPVLEDVH